MINYEFLETMDELPKNGKISSNKDMKGRPVGSMTRYLSREVSRYNRTHNAIKGK